VGGPNKNGPKDDGSCDPYPTTISSKMWIDSDCSYASNETTINWNAPVAYLAGSLQAMELKGWPTTLPSGLERSVRGSSALQLQRSGAELTLQAPAGQILEMVRVLDVAGREVAQFQPKASALRWTPAGRGVFFVHARVADQWQVIRFGQP
jgi:endoglucanase